MLKVLQKTEISIISTLFVLCLALSTYVMNKQSIAGNGDAVQNYMIVDSIAKTGKPMNALIPTIMQAVTLAANKVEDACKLPLTRPKVEAWDHFKTGHPYFIYYAMAPFTKWFSIEGIFAFVTSLAFMGLIFALYFMLRKGGVGILASIAFCFCILSHPAWRMSLLAQPYADRFFLFPGILLMILLSFYPHKISWMVVTALLCCSINDRIGIIVGACTIGFAILSTDLSKRTRAIFIVIGFAAACIGWYLLKYYVVNYFMTGSVTSVSFHSLIDHFKINPSAMGVFLTLNLGILGFFALFSWRSLLVALVAILPNIIINIGGAELTGWSTHYHSTYFPILVWASGMGFIALAKMMKEPIARTALVALPLLCGIYLESTGAPSSMQDLKLSNHQPWHPWDQFPNLLFKSQKEIYPQFTSLKNVIPKGSTVMSLEWTMPALYQDHKILYFPFGANEADYMVIQVEPATLTQKKYYHGSISYAGAKATVELNQCILARLEKMGWNLNEPIFEKYGNAVFQRMKVKQ